MTGPLLVSVREAAQLLGLGRDATYALVRERRLPSIRVGRRVLVPVAALSAWTIAEAERQAGELRP